jgi:hypothetical protein
MFSLPLLGLALLQQVGAAGAFQGATTPPSGDTTGYWQQSIRYQIVATLDEAQSKLRSEAVLIYKNNSPDTLKEMYFHQYLNAFRPESKWSKVDAKENRVRFQNLREPDYGYERLTAAPVVNETPVLIDYPGSPDSTVLHFKLPTPLAPGDSLRVRFAWDARPSTVTRRQGRRGRTWDFAQWYPKVAVYDRGGWEPNPFVPAGELYGEFGTYDVTMVVRDDQILASTGVPVSGDPGWARVSRTGPPYLASNAYHDVAAAPSVQVPAGYRAVRFVGENVHHFAWSASPDYRYEGGVYVRANSARTHFATWDTVGVNVLFKPGDDSTWGGGRAVERTIFAAKWLESIWGPYAYPQITNIHRLDGGGTEFPMMVMNGSASQGLILHEFGHVFTYGILANNEWRSGWMDEGLTDYQTDWAQNLTPQERVTHPAEPPLLARGYRVNAVTIPPADRANLPEVRLELAGRTQPIGTAAYDFSEFGIYNDMIYNRAKLMYGQLRDVMGDSAFLAFTHDYYNRWALKHVDERAMRASAERSWGHALGWFFEQWVHDTGITDYSLRGYTLNTDGQRWQANLTVDREGELRHPMPVGVKTSTGWSIVQADALRDAQTVSVTTNEKPAAVSLDPYHTTYDWDWRNNEPYGTFVGIVHAPRYAFNWPWLNQEDRRHTIVALAPTAWYSDPQGGVLGIRAKTNYLNNVDQYDFGFGLASRVPANSAGDKRNALTQAQIWARGENFYLPGMSRPAMGFGAGANYLDGLLKLDFYKKWDLSPYIDTPGPSIGARAYVTAAIPTDPLFLPEQWSSMRIGEVGGSAFYKTTVFADSEYSVFHLDGGAGFRSPMGGSTDKSGGYLRIMGSAATVRSIVGTATQLHMRLFGGAAPNAPAQRSIFASTADPLETFTNDLFRPRGGLLKQDGVNYLPLGGAGLRGFEIDMPLNAVGSVNGEVVQRLFNTRGAWGNTTVSLSIFGDVGVATSQLITLTNSSLSDAGAGLIFGGKLYDRNYYVRIDAPIFVNQSGFAGGRGLGSGGSLTPRWTLTVGDLFK